MAAAEFGRSVLAPAARLQSAVAIHGHTAHHHHALLKGVDLLLGPVVRRLELNGVAQQLAHARDQALRFRECEPLWHQRFDYSGLGLTA